MKLRISKEVKAGVIVLLLGATMYWLIYFLKGRDIFNKFSLYHIEYQSVEGISATSPVYIRGLKVGTIKEISYNSQKDIFHVIVQLESKYSIPTNSVAQIFSADLLGSKAIRINIGNSIQILDNNEYMQSDISTDILNYLAIELPSIKAQISVILQGLDTSVVRLNSILGIQNQVNIEHTLELLSQTMHHFRSLGEWINGETPQIHTIVENLYQLSAALSTGSTNLETTLSNLSAFSDSLNRANISGAIRTFDLLLDQIKNPDGSIGRLLYSDEIHQNLAHLLSNLDSLVLNISQNPKKYFRISVF